MATILDFDEINELTEYSYNTSDSLDSLVNDIESILINAYLLGVREAERELDEDFDLDVAVMYDLLYEDIDGKDFADRVEEYYNESKDINEDKRALVNKIKRVVVTESHRLINAGKNEVGKSSTKKGKTVYKRWETMGDEKVRATHDYLEGMKVPFEDKFYTFDGDSAYYCGGFSNAENNINCRCWIVLTS